MKLYNTLTKKKEEFVPLEPGKVKMYVCGPTVYNFIHIGNARPMIVFDTARRYMEHKGYEVNYVSNFTDVDDKIIAKANEEGVSSKEVSERYEFMQKQHEDIVTAEAHLTGLMVELEDAMRRQFNAKFKDIKRVFQEVFVELFGGGEARLELTDDDVLESGIRIIAQPPGKKLQNMMQLSGGEKALTAISLLFAIQNLKPSPFCLLDEIEAALDDSNVTRFAKYLHKLTKDTQFIVITHRRGTMMAADVLYGITMQEKGISTQVSVNLIENDLDE